MNVALVHDWLFRMRGGERVLQELALLFPGAPIYTLFYRRGKLSPVLEAGRIIASALNRLPGVERYYRYLLPLYPFAVRALELPESVDVVISSSHCVAKAVRVPDGVPHICYCHTPMRYLWLHGADYFGRLASWLDPLLERLRRWDRQTAEGVTVFLANSHTVRDRIRTCYGRDAEVVYPPVDTDFYRPLGCRRESFYLAVSAFVPYKRLDLAIEACERLRRPLVVVGDGPVARRLHRLAGRFTRFVGWVSEERLRDLYSRCRALLFPANEDFGIVPVEAQACGAPVIAYGRGGATETVVPPEAGVEPTGLWFEEQNAESLCEAICRFERIEKWFDSRALRRHACRFSKDRFRERILSVVNAVAGGEPIHAIRDDSDATRLPAAA